jgi:peptidoglycan/xylan/chitin deacetylase (PgdA/CDA1 family)
LFPFLFRTLSPSGAAARLSIFIFHRVLPVADPLLPYEPSAEQFEWIARFFAKTYNVLPLSEAARRLHEGTLPAAAATITFDDGYADNLEIAWPILKRNSLPATFFISTAFLDGGRMWNDQVIEAVRQAPESQLNLQRFNLGIHTLGDIDSRIACYGNILGRLKYFEHERRAAIAEEIADSCGVPLECGLMMTRDQLRTLRRSGAEIGAHTHTHPILELMDDFQASREIEAGKSELETIIGEPVTVFAYPNGVPGRDCSVRHAKIVKQLGFSAAVTTEPKFASNKSDLHQLPRFTPWDRSPAKFSARCLKQLWQDRS